MKTLLLMMCSFDTTKSTKGASKLRRDLINSEIANLRDLLPLPPSTRQRLSQLQLMALVCVYVRKANYFSQVFKRQELSHFQTPNIGFSKALSGFLMMMTQSGKLLYISDNAAEYLGHSMEDLLIHGDSVFDIIDKQDHAAIQTELSRAPSAPGGDDEERIFLCRMNVSRNARRQMRFGDQKVVLVQGHFLHFLPSLCPRQQPVFLARCTPVAMPETRECVVQGSTNVFTSIHAMDMRYLHIDTNGEFHLGFARRELLGASWYQLLHWESLRDAQAKHRLITQSEQEKSCILLLRLQRKKGDWAWLHVVLQVKDNLESGTPSSVQTTASQTPTGQQQASPVIVCTNQVLSDREAAVMRNNPWLYHYYTVHSKLQFGLTAYETTPPHPQQPQQPQPAQQPQQPSARLPATPLSGGLQYYANSGPTTPISSLSQGSHHLTPPGGLTSYETGGYVHQTQLNTPDSPSNQNLDRNYLNINNIFNFSVTKPPNNNNNNNLPTSKKSSFPVYSGSQLQSSMPPQPRAESAEAHNDNEMLLLQPEVGGGERGSYYSYSSENGVTLTVLRPHAVHRASSRKVLQDSHPHLAASFHELSPPYSSNESSPIQKVPDVDVFNFDKTSEQSVPGSPDFKSHYKAIPLTPEGKSTTSDSECDEKKNGF